MRRVFSILGVAIAAAAQEPAVSAEPRVAVRADVSISFEIRGPLPFGIFTGTVTIPLCSRFPGGPAIVLDGARPRLDIPPPAPEKGARHKTRDRSEARAAGG